MKLAQGWRATLCGVLAWGACIHQASVQARVVETLRPGLLRLRLPRHQPEAVVARQLMRQAAVEFAEPNLVFQAVDGAPPTERCPDPHIVVLDPALAAG